MNFSAQAGVHADFYNMTSFGEDIAARRPDQFLRFVASGSFGYKSIQAPFNIMLSRGQSSASLNSPIPTDDNLFDYITNPVNSVGMEVKVNKESKATLGTYVPKYGLYTSGVLRVFGVGADVTIKKKWRMAFHTGNSQIAVPENLFSDDPGSYVRRVLSGMVGYGKKDDTHLWLTFMRANDRIRSQPDTLSLIPPQQNLVVGLNYKWKVDKHYFIEGELAKTAMTENLLEPLVTSKSRTFSRFMDINSTSRLGSAYKTIVGRKGKILSVKLVGEYIDVGFRSLAFPFQQPDQLNLTVEPKINLMKGKLTFASAIGERTNNLTGEKAAPSKQSLFSLNAGWQATQQLNIAAGFSNFGFRNIVRNDTLKIENVTRSISFSPSYTIQRSSMVHTVTLNVATETFRDFNLITGSEADNDALTLLGTYIIALTGKPLSLNFSAMRFDNQMATTSLLMHTYSAGVDYKIKKSAKTGVKLVYSSNKMGENAAANQVLTQIKYAHQVRKKLAFNFAGSINLYKFGEEKPGVRYRETLVRTSLVYTIK